MFAGTFGIIESTGIGTAFLERQLKFPVFLSQDRLDVSCKWIVGDEPVPPVDDPWAKGPVIRGRTPSGQGAVGRRLVLRVVGGEIRLGQLPSGWVRRGGGGGGLLSGTAMTLN